MVQIRPGQMTGRALSTPPTSPSDNDLYFDDGTNTASGNPGFRWYHDSAWEDIGATSGVSSTPTTGQYTVTDIRLGSDLALIVEYNDTPVS